MTDIKKFKSGAAQSAATIMLVLSSSQLSNINSSGHENDLSSQNDDTTTEMISRAGNEKQYIGTVELISNTMAPYQITRPPLSVYFKPVTGELSDESAEQIKDIAEYLIKTKSTFEVRSCTDPEGNESDNFFLSYRRANAVLDALKKQNVPIKRHYDPDDDDAQNGDVYGTDEECPAPLSGGDDKSQYEKQRRTDILLNPDYSTLGV